MHKHIQLKEILWEITTHCFNNCSYCGSKNSKQIEIENTKILEIANIIVISKYLPKTIIITGGDPLLIDNDVHEQINKIFTAKSIHTNLIFNPKSFLSKHSDYQKQLNKIYNYNWNGISCNTLEELSIIDDVINDLGPSITIITNFNIKNLLIFDKIFEFVKRRNLLWQIQYTLYSIESDLAIYSDDEAYKVFSKKLNDAYTQHEKIILADNCSQSICSAGLMSMGILANGDVVPCLSMRSFVKNLEKEIVGNIFINSFDYIWEEGFFYQRFNDFKCCKDVCNNKCIQLNKNIPPSNLKDVISNKKIINPNKNVFMYGVATKDNVFIYGDDYQPNFTNTNFKTRLKRNIIRVKHEKEKAYKISFKKQEYC